MPVVVFGILNPLKHCPNYYVKGNFIVRNLITLIKKTTLKINTICLMTFLFLIY